MPGAVEDYRTHAEFRARKSPSGIGAAVTRSEFDDGERLWDCIVTDADTWHYVRVLGRDLGPYPDIYPENVERGIERLAGTLPVEGRLQYLLDLNPLHIDARGTVGD
jgi:hypothetical protein